MVGIEGNGRHAREEGNARDAVREAEHASGGESGKGEKRSAAGRLRGEAGPDPGSGAADVVFDRLRGEERWRRSGPAGAAASAGDEHLRGGCR
jgi:hypothetical protein